MGPLARAVAEVQARGGWIPPPRRGGAATISGAVIDAATNEGVGGVEVVFRNDAGEETTIAGPDGRYRIDLPIGTYRAFIRDETVISVGYAERVRLPGLPEADAAGAPDDALMPVVVASGDADGVDLTVTRGGVVRGKVVDRAGRPIANAVLQALTQGLRLRPTLGTDVAETGTDGAFELRLAPGRYGVDVSHPRFAGVAGPEGRLEIAPGEVQTATFTLVAGCVISGRVVGANGQPAGEGAIERQWGERDVDFAPAGRIAADGTFRWATTDEGEIVLRAWPWKSPPSPMRAFACRDGARFEGVQLTLDDVGPDLDGILVDHGGAPVALAYIDLAPLDDGGIHQQERTDEHGRWSVFRLPAGRYQVTAYAEGRGVLATTVSAPQTEVRLQLGGTGRLEGRTPLLASGSFDLVLQRCDHDETPVRLPPVRRIVTVTNHRFSVDDVPACNLQLLGTWRGRSSYGSADVPAGGVAQVELGLGPPREIVVQGTVTDSDGRPVEDAVVRAYFDREESADTTTDAAGRYRLRTYAGAMILGRKDLGGVIHGAHGETGASGGDEQTVDLTLLNLTSPSRPEEEEEEEMVTEEMVTEEMVTEEMETEETEEMDVPDEPSDE
jgi:hypothetical protein